MTSPRDEQNSTTFVSPAHTQGIDRDRMATLIAMAKKFYDRTVGYQYDLEAFGCENLEELFNLKELSLLNLEVSKAIVNKQTI